MSGRDDKLYAEAVALWRHVRGGEPPADAEPSRVLDLLLCAEPPAAYDRLATPHLRAANIAFPRRD